MNNAKIFIVEDEVIVAMNIEKRLRSSGYKVTGIASSSEQAIEKIELEKPDLVLMDIKIKGVHDGIDTADLIRKKYNLPIIYLTSYTDEETFNRAKLTEPFGYLIKPFETKELNRIIEMALYKNEINKKLIDNQQRFEIAVKAGRTCVWELLLNEKKLIADKNFIEFFKERSDSVIVSFNDWLKLFSDEDKNTFLGLINKCCNENCPELFFEHKIKTNIDHEFWVTENAIVLRQEDDKSIRLVGASTDITDRKKSEIELSKSEQRFRSVFENSGVGMAIFPPDKAYSRVNKAFCAMLGYSEDELLKMSFSDVTYPGDIKKSIDLHNSLIEGDIKESVNLEKRYLHKNGNAVWSSTTASLVKDSNYKPLYFIIQCQNITKRKEAEEALAIYNEQLKSLNVSKDKFFSIISHDLRSPFNALLGITEYMVQFYKDMNRDEVLDSLNNVHKSAQKLYNLILNLLEWSRLQTGRLEVEKSKINLNKMCNDITLLYKEMSDSKKILLTSNVPENLNIYADKYMLETVMRNLVSNAIKFTRTDGQVSINVETENELAKVSVEDSGIGISKEDMEKLFRIDVQYKHDGTASEKGTGLGLILCKEFVEKNGGSISVESKLNIGSKFIFTVPLAQN